MSKPEPRYRQILQVLEERLSTGIYEPGSLLPTEADLVAEFGASRFTVREALRKLTEAGYVARTRGRGTEVLSGNPERGFTQSFQTLNELFQVALNTWFVVHDTQMVVLDEELAMRVGGIAGESWFRITGVRWTEPGGRAICMIESYIPQRFESVIPQLNDHVGPFFSLLESHEKMPIEQVRQEICAMEMPPAFCKRLGLQANTLSLRLLRRYHTAKGVLIASFNWHPADRFTYTMNINRSGRS